MSYGTISEDFSRPKKWEDAPKEQWSERLTDTAGFVPLDVRFKQMEQAGYKAQFMSSDFDTSDLQNLWSIPQLDYSPYDELEDMKEKDNLREVITQELLKLRETKPAAQVNDVVNKPEIKEKLDSIPNMAEQPAE